MIHSPNSASKANGECKKWHIGLVEGPVPGGKCRRQHHFTQCRNEEDAPEEANDVGNLLLENNNVFLTY